MKKHSDILNTRADDKLLKALTETVKDEMDTLTADELKQVVIGAHDAMKTAKSKLEGHEGYQQAKKDVSNFSAGKKEVDKYQKAKIEYACMRLEDMGKVTMHDRIELDYALSAAKRDLAKRKQERFETESKSGPVYKICLDCNKRKPCICEKALNIVGEDPVLLTSAEDSGNDADMENVTVSVNGGLETSFKNLAKALRES